MFDRKYIEDSFRTYTEAYDASDVKVKLKIDHTYRVANLCEEIAKSISLSEEDVTLAWVCGMLHDIGRFEQVKRYGTFFDSISVNHARFGADLLFHEGLYEKMVQKGNEASKDLIEKAIRVHNMFRIPEDLSCREKMFANILRDADKIDILRVACENPPEEVYNVTTKELINAPVSEEAKQAFREKRCAKRTDRTTAIDYLVGHVCLTFELVYKRSKELMFEQGYLFKLMEFQSNNQQTNEWFAYMKEKMEDERKSNVP